MAHPLEFLHPRSLGLLSGKVHSLIKTKLWMKILVGMVLGILVGLLLSETFDLVERQTALTIGSWLALPGNIFLGLIQMIVVPLVFASVITGLASSDSMEQLRKVGSRLVIYFVCTTSLAITIGIVAGLVIQPGNYIDGAMMRDLGAEVPEAVTEGDDLAAPAAVDIPDVLTEILPQNPLGAMVNAEMLQVVLFALIFGMALISIGTREAEPLINLLSSVQEVCMTIVGWAMLLAPVAVFGLLAQITLEVGLDALAGVIVYVVTVLTGLGFLLLMYMAIVYFLAHKSPLWFLRTIREVQLLGFSTSSSAAVMPLSIRTAEKDLEITPSISQFIIPLGATINMDGTALYQGVATVFLAQVFGVELSLAAMVLVVVTAVGASIGTPATPGVGIVILSMVLQSVGIPTAGIALIIGVDRILDMSRTALNVTGDLTAALVMDRWFGSKDDDQDTQLEQDSTA